jgi:hypothetical protein
MPDHYPNHPSWDLLDDLDQYEIRALMVIEWRVLTKLYRLQQECEPPWDQTPTVGRPDTGSEWLHLALLIEIHLGHWEELQRRHDAQVPGSLGIWQISPSALPFDVDVLKNAEYAPEVYKQSGWPGWESRPTQEEPESESEGNGP